MTSFRQELLDTLNLTKMQRAALKKVGETSKALAEEIDKPVGGTMQERNFKAIILSNHTKRMRDLKSGDFFLDDEGQSLCQVVDSEQVDLLNALPSKSDFVIGEDSIVFFCDLESGTLHCDNQIDKSVEVPISVDISYRIAKT
jgi:hypothetical protein